MEMVKALARPGLVSVVEWADRYSRHPSPSDNATRWIENCRSLSLCCRAYTYLLHSPWYTNLMLDWGLASQAQDAVLARAPVLALASGLDVMDWMCQPSTRLNLYIYFCSQHGCMEQPTWSDNSR